MDYLDLNIPPDTIVQAESKEEASVIELGRPHVWVTIVAKDKEKAKQETDQLELEAQLRTFFKLRPGELTFAYRTGSLYMEVVGPDWAMVTLMGAVAVADPAFVALCAKYDLTPESATFGLAVPDGEPVPARKAKVETASVASHTAAHPVLNLWLRVDESVALDEASTFDTTAVSIAAGKLIPCEQIDASLEPPLGETTTEPRKLHLRLHLGGVAELHQLRDKVLVDTTFEHALSAGLGMTLELDRSNFAKRVRRRRAEAGRAHAVPGEQDGRVPQG